MRAIKFTASLIVSAGADIIKEGPVYIHPSTLKYKVETNVGQASLVFGMASFYDETLPSDFKDIGEFVKAYVEALFEIGNDLEGAATCNQSIKAYAHKELVALIESPPPFPCVMRTFISQRLSLVHNSVRSVMFERIMKRSMLLDIYSHPFERLYEHSFPTKTAIVDDTHMASVNWTADGVHFKQSHPNVEVSIEGKLQKSTANFAIMSVYFDWSVLNSAVTERWPFESNTTADGDTITGKPMKARKRFTKHHMTTQLVLQPDGSINLACITDAKQGHLIVSARDSEHMRKHGIETPGVVIWRGVHRICEILLEII
jgi:hypothetical protein